METLYLSASSSENSFGGLRAYNSRGTNKIFTHCGEATNLIESARLELNLIAFGLELGLGSKANGLASVPKGLEPITN